MRKSQMISLTVLGDSDGGNIRLHAFARASGLYR